MNSDLSVFIVESPSCEDLQLGRLEGKVLREALAYVGIPASYTVARSKAAFWQALADASQSFLQLPTPLRWPVVHLSSHGTPYGLGFTDGTSPCLV